MKNKQVFIAIVLGLVLLTSKTQAQQWNWANYGYGDVLQGAYSIASDANGNVYITGQTWSDNVNFPGLTKPLANDNRPDPNMFVASYDVSSGNLNWAANAFSDAANEAYSISTGSDGIYVTGAFIGSQIIFYNMDGSYNNSINKIYNNSSRTFYLVKYSFTGDVSWVSKIEDGGGGTAYSVTDPFGNVYITGFFSGNANLTFYSQGGTTPACTLTNSNSYQAVYIASYDANGSFRWAEIAGGKDEGIDNYDMGTCVTTDVSGNVYLAGYFESSTISFGSCNSCSLTRKATTGNADMFLVQYNPTNGIAKKG